MDPNYNPKGIPSKINWDYLILIFLCVGALFIKNPKVYGIAIIDVSIFLGVLTLINYKYSSKIKFQYFVIVAIALVFIAYMGIGLFKVPSIPIFVKYYARILKSFLVAFLGFSFFIRLNPILQLSIVRLFFNLAIVTILLDTVYSVYFFSTRTTVNVWTLYSSLKVSYLYADKNMVAFTISLLMVISNRFFAKKYIYLLWFLTIISLSRSGILINTIILFYFMGFRLIKPSILLPIFLTLLITIGLVYALNLSDLFIDRLSLNNDLSMAGRLGLQRMGINMWLASPFTGQGLSGYEQHFYSFFEGGEHTPFPHNLFIYILSEQGLIGFLMFSLIFSLLWLNFLTKKLGMLIMSYLMFGMFLFNLTEYHFFFLVGVFLAFNPNLFKFENRIHPTLASQ